MSEILAEPRIMRNCIDRALGRLSESDWQVITEQAAMLTEQVNTINPKLRFDIVDALEVLAKIGIFLTGERRNGKT